MHAAAEASKGSSVGVGVGVVVGVGDCRAAGASTTLSTALDGSAACGGVGVVDPVVVVVVVVVGDSGGGGGSSVIGDSVDFAVSEDAISVSQFSSSVVGLVIVAAAVFVVVGVVVCGMTARTIKRSLCCVCCCSHCLWTLCSGRGGRVRAAGSVLCYCG